MCRRERAGPMNQQTRGPADGPGGAAFAYPGVSRRARAVVGGDGRGGGERGEREREGIGGGRRVQRAAGRVRRGWSGLPGGKAAGRARRKLGVGPGLAGARRWGALPCRRGPGAGAGEGEPVDSGECGGGRLVLGQAGCGPDPMKRPSAGRQGAGRLGAATRVISG